jgi:predicted kinase
MTAELVLLMGISGAGKSTWTAANAPHHHLATYDAIRTNKAPAAVIVPNVRRKAQAALEAGTDVVHDACNLDPRHRKWWLKLARQHRATTRLIIIHPPSTSVLADRQDDRGNAAMDWPEVQKQLARWDTAHKVAQREMWGTITHVNAPTPTGPTVEIARTSRAW